MNRLHFRRATDDDVEFLMWLRKTTMDIHLRKSGLLLSDEDHLSRIRHLYDKATIILYQDTKIGLLKLDEKEGEIEIVQIQIDPVFQGKGFGKDIIFSVIRSALDQKKTLFLSVLEVNPAKSLYARLGFQVTGQYGAEVRMRYNPTYNHPDGV